ncbi:hypothetical protein ZWY2020_004959 [Hordeum vulgare]|nr:hypothetical protein ZWY2020_004959 [Hordeum vulgare]
MHTAAGAELSQPAASPRPRRRTLLYSGGAPGFPHLVGAADADRRLAPPTVPRIVPQPPRRRSPVSRLALSCSLPPLVIRRRRDPVRRPCCLRDLLPIFKATGLSPLHAGLATGGGPR